MKMQLSPAFLSAAVVSIFLMALSPIASADPTVVISDSLSSAGHPEMSPGRSLNGIKVEKGHAYWVVPTAQSPYTSPPWSCSISGKGTVLSASGNSVTWSEGAPKTEPTSANIAIPKSAGKITVQADVMVGSAPWAGVTLAGSPQDLVFTPGNLLIAEINKEGTWNLYHDLGATQTVLATGHADNVTPTGFVTIGLRFDPATSKASLLVNGRDVSGPIPTKLSSTTLVGSAGFYFYGPTADIQVKNFEVSEDSSTDSSAHPDLNGTP